MLKFLNITAGFLLVASPLFAESKFGIGRTALPEEIAAWDLDVKPDGTGLPVGSGNVLWGEEVFADKCASCHGDFAEGMGNWPKLAGGADTLADKDPLKTVGSFWPYLSTTWDYVNRSMPFGEAQSLTSDEVYGVVAYILYSNDLVDEDFTLSNQTFLDVEMPNHDGFILDDRLENEHKLWVGEPCMENCKDEVKVTMRALVLDVTPEQAEVGVSDAGEATQVELSEIDPELAATGEKVFRKCKSCHQVGEGAKNKSGPVLTGIIGKTIGSVDGFKYSKAFKKAAEEGLVWSDDKLAEFLTKPRSSIKGTKMSFSGLKKESDRDAIIEYLKSIQ